MVDLKKEISSSLALTIVLIVSFVTGVLLWITIHSAQFPLPRLVPIQRSLHHPMAFEAINRPKPQPVSMDRLKLQGCVADGFLSEYNPNWEKFDALINRSNCYYLHRAVETWLTPPDFNTIDFEINRVTKQNLVYGMFIAEAINTRAQYYNDYTHQTFDFEKMCQPGSTNRWGPHTCIPTFSSSEYRDYITYITEKAIDLGVQSFTFGQIYLQEGTSHSYAPEIVAKIRAYAKQQGVDVVIGAQTGSITNPSYLQLFDYIEGGVGIDAAGGIQSGPCLVGRGGCWALLWNQTFSAKAKNVLLDLDWSGVTFDDLDIFARMTKAQRATTLTNLYNYFKARNMGFLMPFFGVLDRENGGCYGPKKLFYSPDRAYSCQDEDTINSLLSGK